MTSGHSGVFSGTAVSSTNKTDWHNISEILLKVALNTINLFLYVIYDSWPHMVVLLISLSQEVLTLPEYRNSSPIYILITGSAYPYGIYEFMPDF